MPSEFDWKAAVRELIRQFPELDRFEWKGLAHSLAYVLERGYDPDSTRTPPIPEYETVE